MLKMFQEQKQDVKNNSTSSLSEVIKKPSNLSEEAKKVLTLFNKNYIAARTIRTLGDILTDDSTPIIADMKEEFKSLQAKKNSKHAGGHFATTLLVPSKPIAVYKHKIGLLFNISGLEVANYCLSDAHDDKGKIHESVERVRSYKEFVTAIRNTPKEPRGFVVMNELQIYLSRESCVGVFVAINATIDDDTLLNQHLNIAAYLEAYAVSLLVYKNFKIDLPVFLYDQSHGQLLSVTRRAEPSVLLNYVNLLNNANFENLGLNTTDKNKLADINSRLLRRLDLTLKQEELDKLVSTSLEYSYLGEQQETIKYFKEVMMQHHFPQSITLRYSQTNNCYQIVIPGAIYQGLVAKRMAEMANKMELEIIFDSRNFYKINVGLKDLTDKVYKYFYSLEPIDRVEQVEQQQEISASSSKRGHKKTMTPAYVDNSVLASSRTLKSNNFLPPPRSSSNSLPGSNCNASLSHNSSSSSSTSNIKK